MRQYRGPLPPIRITEPCRLPMTRAFIAVLIAAVSTIAGTANAQTTPAKPPSQARPAPAKPAPASQAPAQPQAQGQFLSPYDPDTLTPEERIGPGDLLQA